MHVFYYLQGEECESLHQLNCFEVAAGNQEVKLMEFVMKFPLSKAGGVYHFRFRAQDKESGYAWLDLQDPQAVLPKYNDMVCAKVLRLDKLPHPRVSRLRRKPAPTGAAASQSQRRQPQHQPQPDSASKAPPPIPPLPHHARARSASPGPHQSPASPSRKTPGRRPKSVTPPHSHGAQQQQQQQQHKPAASEGNLEDFLFSESPPSSPKQQSNSGDLMNFGGDNLMNMGNDSPYSSPKRKGPSKASNSPLPGSPGAQGPQPSMPGRGISSSLPGSGSASAASTPVQVRSPQVSQVKRPTPSQDPGKNIKGVKIGAGCTSDKPTSSLPLDHNHTNCHMGGDKSTKSAHVAAKMEERERKLHEDTAKAVQFKRGLDAAAEREQDALDEAKAKHEASLLHWCEEHGQKRNIRTLLSTMHQVLWEGARWKATSMSDLIPPGRVKFSYRKAMLVVHPDKCTELNSEQRFIAKRVFEAVNEAYSSFAAQEMAG
ncbi:unnamed protein product [Chrysoparadoxa australica]